MINKNFIIFFMIVIGICAIFSVYFSNNLNERFENSVYEAYQNCNQMTDCKQCIDTMTAKDGICYWCDGKCTASADYYEGCSSSFRNCNTPTPTPDPTPTPEPTPTPTPEPTPEPTPTPTPKPFCPTCPICKTCPKLTKLKNNTYITEQ